MIFEVQTQESDANISSAQTRLHFSVSKTERLTTPRYRHFTMNWSVYTLRS